MTARRRGERKTEFSDSDLLGLVCPRPLLLQNGQADATAWWPQVPAGCAEWKQHGPRLGLGARVAIDLHARGREVRVETGRAWLLPWLRPGR